MLDLYGLSVIPMDNGMVKVVRSSIARTAGAPLADGKNPGKGDEIITRVVRMEKRACSRAGAAAASAQRCHRHR